MKAVTERWALWLAAAVLVASVAAFAITRYTGSSSTAAQPHRAAPLVAAERSVAREFVDTAVARKQLERAWSIVTPELKQGMSLDEWKTGTIPVVPYPVPEANVVLRVVDSFTDTARLRVTFLPRPGAKARSASFSLDLRNVGGRWLVSSWQPSSVIGPPAGK